MTIFHLGVFLTLFFLPTCFYKQSDGQDDKAHVEVEDSHDLDAQVRVLGGRSCSTKQYGFMVLVIRTHQGTSYRTCGGTLFKPGWVLTAAHCIDESKSNYYSVIIAANTHKRTILVEKYYVHQKYSKKDSHVNDIALLELSSRLDAYFRNGDIKLVNLPKPEDNDTDPICEDGLIMGWGKMRSSEVPEIPDLQCGDVELIPNRNCEDIFRSRHYRIYQSQICTYSEKGVAAYVGDSGGPLMCGEVQVGIVSWGMGKDEPFPNVFTKISDHFDFINQVQQGHFNGTCVLGPILFLTIFMLISCILVK
ncbi:unnamed protein product [Ceutorhynchus assimilis]|uniref:Peptidase S1 domain-containing protein n=1 Tax=Ceutorhynchus assimilis TaxID=467358 RepID=A0A9N9MKT6_9CUCU|nr:unnamed protein product [Ceutorhynchus assimilis]